MKLHNFTKYLLYTGMNWNEAESNQIMTMRQKTPVLISGNLVLDYLRMKIVS